MAALATNPKASKKDTTDDGVSPTPLSPRHVSRYAISPATAGVLGERGITELTDIQALTFNDVFSGKDIIGRSQTGTGKTLAFGLPIVERLVIMQRESRTAAAASSDRAGDDGTPAAAPLPSGKGRAPIAIVLAPTRELARQVSEQLEAIGRPHRLSVACFYGGASYTPQESALQRGLDILVGTPGRIIDHLQRGTLDLSHIRVAVLDEADEMLSMGFAEDVETIFSKMPPKADRQTILFSATMPSWVVKMASQHQRLPVIHDAVGRGETRTSKTVRHIAVRVPSEESVRAALLEDILLAYGSGDGGGGTGLRCIVFTETKREADELVGSSSVFRGTVAQVLHGDVSQRQRETTLSQFKMGRFGILVATDVAARGIDISDVDVVLQFRTPRDPDTYIHRSGRTGRAGRAGTAVVLHSDSETGLLRRLEREAGITFERAGPPTTELMLRLAANQMVRTVGDASTSAVIPHFEAAAAQLLREQFEGDAQRALAAALAVASGRTRITHRSVLTGEDGLRTLLLTTPGDALEPRDVLGIVRRLSGGGQHFADQVGKVRLCRDARQAVFDVPAASADAILQLLQQAEGQLGGAEEGPPAGDTGLAAAVVLLSAGVRLEACMQLPPLQSEERERAHSRSRFRGRSRYGADASGVAVEEDEEDAMEDMGYGGRFRGRGGSSNAASRDARNGRMGVRSEHGSSDRTGRRERFDRRRGGRPVSRRARMP